MSSTGRPFMKKRKYATALSKAKSQGATKPVPFEKIVITSHIRPHTNEGWIDILNESIALSHLKLKVQIFQSKTEVFCLLQIQDADGISNLAEGEGCDNFEAKLAASKKAFEILLKNCYTLNNFQTPEASTGDETNLDQILTWADKKEPKRSDKKEPKRLSEDSIGARMMKTMGWTGGGLGKHGTGITEPIKEETSKNRSGLGLKPDLGHKPNQSAHEAQFKGAVNNLLKDFAQRKPDTKLFFSSNLSSNHKKIIESCAKGKWKRKLKCERSGENNDSIVVSPVFTPLELVQRVMSEGGKTDQYIAFPPDTLSLESFEGLSQKKLDLRPPQTSLCSNSEFTPIPFEKIFVLSRFQNKFANGWTDVLVVSMVFSKFKIRDQFVRTGDKVSCTLQIFDGTTTSDLAEGEGNNEIEAKLSASTNALEVMLKNCYTVKVHKVPIDNVLSEEDILSWCSEKSGLISGGLGNDGSLHTTNKRTLRHPRALLHGKIKTDADVQFVDAINNMLQDFTKRKPLTNLFFSPRLPRHRKDLIRNCVKFYWKSQLSYDTVFYDKTPYPYISLMFEADELVNKILSEGGKTDQYVVYPPDTLTLDGLKDQLEKKIAFRKCTMVSHCDLGLGSEDTTAISFEQAIKKLLKDFVERQPQTPLAFPSDLSNSQRAIIHQTVRERKKTGIKSKSYGMDPNRFIVVYMNDEEEFELE